MNSFNKLLGKWIYTVLFNHFKNQKNDNTDKIFIKVSGLSEDNIHGVLNELKEKNQELNKFYTPIIRTLKAVPEFPEFQLKAIETSTWLRNNTFPNHALVMIINELTPEAQSLENLFAIDEAYLLSNEGFESLYSILSIEYKLAAEEIDTIKGFIKMYKSLTEPQLRFILRFISHVLKDPSDSIVRKLQFNLPELNLFKDTQLIFNSKGLKRLRSNFLLSNLQKPNGELDSEKLQNNLYAFLDGEENNGYTSELWLETKPEEFEIECLDFINQKNLELLKHEYEIIESVFNFRVKTTLPDKIKDALSIDDLQKDQKDKAEQGINAIDKNENADDIQEFLEEFETQLPPALVKTITRKIEKLRNPKEYRDIMDALIYETFQMVEEQTGSLGSKECRFILEVNSSKLTSNSYFLLNLYLNNIENIISTVRFDKESINKILIDESTDDSLLTFKLTFQIGGNAVQTESFKVTGFKELNLLSLTESIEKDNLPYLKSYQEDEVEVVDINNLVLKQIEGYLAINEPGINEHYKNFKAFSEYFIEILKNVCSDGIFSIDFKDLKDHLTSLLEGINSTVTICSHIYRHINYIGAIDTLDIKRGQSGFSNERILTVFNPIRLCAYLSRFQELNLQIENWITRARDENLEVSHLDDYLGHVSENILYLAPRYFSSDGDDTFLIEVSEILGEGHFILNTKRSETMDHLSQELSEELLKTVKNYFEVYPYAKDGLDILFLYCQSADIIIKSIDVLFNKISSLKKLKITVHSSQAALVHQRLNNWIRLKEEYTNPDSLGKFPKVEIKVISGNSINDISLQIQDNMIDTDLVVLADYFGQSNQIKFEFDKIEPKPSNNWFEVVYKEPLLKTEGMKRISFVSEHLPDILKQFYQLQYIYQKKEMLDVNELFVLKNKISLSHFTDNELIDFMHDNFNWIMFIDRYLDKSLLENASSKAQIIQYKSKAGSNKNYKLIVSSSEYIKKLNSKNDDYEYYDRLSKKLGLILKNNNVKKDKMVEAINVVKSISGALVLKAIGPGKYSHELIATYLSKKYRFEDSNVLQVWTVCDELPWFRSNNRRPDLVITTIKEDTEGFKVDFELLELKFVNHSIFERERYDAIKQIESGINLYEKLFRFDQNKTDSAYWRDELVHYFLERESYSPEQAYLLKKLQNMDVSNIKVNITSAIDAYCYTSNLYEYNFEKVIDGVFVDILDGEYKNNIFNRSYVLNSLGIMEVNEPVYDELDESLSSFQESLSKIENVEENELINSEGTESNEKIVEDGHAEAEDSLNENTGAEAEDSLNKNTGAEAEDSLNENTREDVEDSSNANDSETNDGLDTGVDLIPKVSNKSGYKYYPEKKALEGLETNHTVNSNDDHSELKRKYVGTIETYFNRNNINVKVKNIIVGSSVIRLILDIPSSVNSDKIMKRGQELQLRLGLDQEPNIFIDKNGINVDIVREDPDTIFFENFMAISREQLNDKIKETNLVAPLGFDPLNNVLYIDFSDPSTPHLLTGGTTGSGKSVTLNSIILSTMCLYDKNKLQFVFIDPKQVEFTVYKNLPHTKSVVTDINEAVFVLEQLVNEMESRYSLFSEEYVTNLDEYVSITKKGLPRIVVVFDEFADFMSQEKEIAGRVENAILRLGQKARAAGIHLIICTQNPKSDIINTNIRNNLGARLALKATDSTASSVILGESGAENLGGKGDFLAKTGSQKVQRGKSPFLTPEVKRALLKYFASLK
ncbi:FtsK/SpoIIIE domain-containing protein [Neobacillus cucumis]|uniref:FtsK/SpoIIIE domain-containing protein n=1 Tax=Neobacillus cucumis TaxID=1740721 RepID=UPI0020402716|nr:FtsK/SpoIIIE domain-containing protein [Neobacillus cucumis]MCM3729908.1 FtsK/SpoIIIE domain-containing protein [Neobacillus cucumis]